MLVEEQVKAFGEMSRDQKISYLIIFYQTMISNSKQKENKNKFRNIIERLQAYQETTENTFQITTLYRKICEVVQSDQENEQMERSDTLRSIQQLVDPDQDNADDFLEDQLAGIGG